jgi:rubrerythrin
VERDPNPSLSRRSLIRNGTLTLSFGALVAACGGDDRLPPSAPGRLGLADEAEPLPQEPVDDVILLRTAQSLEYTAIDVYAAAAATGALGSDESALVQRFVDDHVRHADDVGALISQLGGEPFTCANPFLVDRAVAPVLAALEGTDDLRRDLLNISYAFESMAGASYQALIALLSDPAVRVAAMTVGGEEQRHAAAVAAVLNPATYFSPELTGGQPESDEDGIPLRYSIPSQFGRVDGIELVVGAVDDEGSRFSTTLQTPAANTLIYSDQSC